MSRILNLLLPTPCVLCSKLGAPLCLTCIENFPTRPIPIELSGVHGFAVSDYTEQAAIIVNSVKEKGLTSLTPAIADLITNAWPNSHHAFTYVPVPSSQANTKKRGFSHTALLANELSKRVPESRTRHLLRSFGSRADQVGLAPLERARNMDGAFKAELWGAQNQRGPIVLVDDVITSGATLKSAIRTLAESGLNAGSFLVFARAGGN